MHEPTSHVLELVDRNPLCTIIPSSMKAKLIINDGLLPLSSKAQTLLNDPDGFQRSAFRHFGTIEDLRHMFETSPMNAKAHSRSLKRILSVPPTHPRRATLRRGRMLSREHLEFDVTNHFTPPYIPCVPRGTWGSLMWLL